MAKVAVAEAIARSCFSCAFALINMQDSVTRIEREGTGDQIGRYLPGTDGRLAHLRPLSQRARSGQRLCGNQDSRDQVHRRVGNHGEKAWVTDGAIVNLLVVYAQTEPGAGAKGIASFLIRLHAPGIEMLPLSADRRRGDRRVRRPPSPRESG